MDIVIQDLVTFTNEFRGLKGQQNSISAKVFQNKVSLH